VHFWGTPTICLTRVLMSGKRPIKVRPSNLIQKPPGSLCAEPPPKTDQHQSASSFMVCHFGSYMRSIMRGSPHGAQLSKDQDRPRDADSWPSVLWGPGLEIDDL
jgi:hypothetical protein